MKNDASDPLDDLVKLWESGQSNNSSGVLYKRLSIRFEEIETMMFGGKSHQNIVDDLNAVGVEISLSTFRTYLYRYRRENADWNQQMRESRNRRKFVG